jgi:signal peptidase I
MNSHKYKLYQFKKIFSRYHGYLPLEQYNKYHGDLVNINRYNVVFEDTINTYLDFEIDILDSLFRLFNEEHPRNFKGNSMSVGDIVEIFGKFYYCDSVGWKEIKVTNKIPKIAIDEYLSFEHHDTLENLTKRKRLLVKDENLVMQYVSDLSKDFAQFCWEEGYEPQKVYFIKNKTND